MWCIKYRGRSGFLPNNTKQLMKVDGGVKWRLANSTMAASCQGFVVFYSTSGKWLYPVKPKLYSTKHHLQYELITALRKTKHPPNRDDPSLEKQWWESLSVFLSFYPVFFWAWFVDFSWPVCCAAARGNGSWLNHCQLRGRGEWNKRACCVGVKSFLKKKLFYLQA